MYLESPLKQNEANHEVIFFFPSYFSPDNLWNPSYKYIILKIGWKLKENEASKLSVKIPYYYLKKKKNPREICQGKSLF